MNDQRLISLDSINYKYASGSREVHALQDISLNIDGGGVMAISGPSGSGKSTLMYVLGLLLTAASGNYELYGHKITGTDEVHKAELRNRFFGFVFQKFNLLPRVSALDNVALPLVYAGVRRKERRRQAAEILSRVGLEKRVKHYPNELSGGEQQRVAIARALINNPRVILADEPTGNLDSRTGHKIMELFQELADGGISVVLVSHDRDLVQKASRVIRMVDGRICYQDYGSDGA